MATPLPPPPYGQQPVDGVDNVDGPASPSSPRGPGACSSGEIPVIDLRDLFSGAGDRRSQAIRDLGRACEDWGIFMVINHGVPEALQEAMMDASKEFLSLPREEKMEYLQAGPMDPIRVGTGFYSAVDGADYRRNYMKMFTHPEFYCPEKPAKLRETATEYSNCTRGLLLELAKAISESLGLHCGRLSEALNLDSCLQVLVGSLYPPYTGPDDWAMGFPAHSDHGLLTLLCQNGVDGLEVMHNGQWLLAKPLPGSCFVIAGDQLEIVSNGRYRGVLHRAVVDSERMRTSFLSLMGPCLDAIVEPLPELARDGEGMEFRGIKYRAYLEHQQTTKLNEKAALDIVRVQYQRHSSAEA